VTDSGSLARYASAFVASSGLRFCPPNVSRGTRWRACRVRRTRRVRYTHTPPPASHERAIAAQARSCRRRQPSRVDWVDGLHHTRAHPLCPHVNRLNDVGRIWVDHDVAAAIRVPLARKALAEQRPASPDVPRYRKTDSPSGNVLSSAARISAHGRCGASSGATPAVGSFGARESSIALSWKAERQIGERVAAGWTARSRIGPSATAAPYMLRGALTS
jgi:hypothetical protein